MYPLEGEALSVSRKSPTEAFDRAKQRWDKRRAFQPASLLSIADLSPSQAFELVELAAEMKARPEPFAELGRGYSIAMLFEKPSTRTRCSFEAAARRLSMESSYIDWRTSNFSRSDVYDEIRVLSRYYDLIVARVFQHDTLVTMAAESEVPVINGLSDLEHPCQALADVLTMREYFGDLQDLNVVYLGDCNNVFRSLSLLASRLGFRVIASSPPEFAPSEQLTDLLGSSFTFEADPKAALRNADVIYTDTWVSMGDERDSKRRVAALSPWSLTVELLAHAPATSLVMHCLPAHPGEEIDAEVLRSPRSIVFDQAENRTYAQQALLTKLLGWVGSL